MYSRKTETFARSPYRTTHVSHSFVILFVQLEFFGGAERFKKGFNMQRYCYSL